MNRQLKDEDEQCLNGRMSRRSFITTAGMVAVGGVLAGGAMAAVAGTKEAAPVTSPILPWTWVRLDPMEAGKRAFQTYHAKGG